MAKRKTPPAAIDVVAKETQTLLFDALNKEGDLPSVLVGTSYLDRCLQSLLHHFFVKCSTADSILEPEGTLGSLDAKAKLAYCLGLIPKGIRSNLQTVGEIRNLFAHRHFEMTFDDPEISELCGTLTLPKAHGRLIKEDQVSVVQNVWERFSQPRAKFTICVALMATMIVVEGLRTKKLPMKDGWN